MAINIANSIHAFINKKMRKDSQESTAVFPVTTSDDVIINDDGDYLTEFITTVDNSKLNPTEKAPLCVVTSKEETISDAALNAILGK